MSVSYTTEGFKNTAKWKNPITYDFSVLPKIKAVFTAFSFLDKNYNKIVNNINQTFKGIKTEKIMCKIQGVNIELRNIKFERRGYITFYFDDKRIVSVPLSNFPPIKRLNAQQRKNWQILDGHFFSFNAITEAYSITDILYM